MGDYRRQCWWVLHRPRTRYPLLWHNQEDQASYGPNQPDQNLRPSDFCGILHLESLRLSMVFATYTLPQKERFRQFALYSIFKVRNIGLAHLIPLRLILLNILLTKPIFRTLKIE